MVSLRSGPDQARPNLSGDTQVRPGTPSVMELARPRGGIDTRWPGGAGRRIKTQRSATEIKLRNWQSSQSQAGRARFNHSRLIPPEFFFPPPASLLIWSRCRNKEGSLFRIIASYCVTFPFTYLFPLFSPSRKSSPSHVEGPAFKARRKAPIISIPKE